MPHAPASPAEIASLTPDSWHPLLAGSAGRLGTETAFEVLARAQALAAEGRSILNLGIGQPDFRTPEPIVEAAVKALRDGHHGYTPANGILPLREAVAHDVEARTGAAVDPGRVVIVPGGKVTMFMAIALLGEPGAEIVYPDPGFPIYRSLVEWSGATPVPLRLTEDTGFAMTAEAVLERVTPRTRLVILNSPANPTGGASAAEEIDRLAEGLADHPHCVLLSDEIYSRLVYDGRPHESLMSRPSLAERTILLDGWSKTYAMTGWRLGYGVWPAEMVEPAVRLAVNTHSCVNAATQWAGIEALQGSQEPVETMLSAFEQRRAWLIPALNRLPGVTCLEPAGAFYAFPNVSGTGFSSRSLQTALLEEMGVATIAGTSFGPAGEGYLRLSYAASLETLEEAVERIRNWLERRAG